MFFPPNGNYGNGNKSITNNSSINSLQNGNSNVNRYQIGGNSQNLGYRGGAQLDSITPTMIRQSTISGGVNSSNISHSFTNSVSLNPENSSSNNNSGGNLSSEEFKKWSSMIDNCLVEFLAALFINLVTILCWDWSGDNYFLQFIPAIVYGIVLLCLKDGDYFFPDALPTVTLLVWAIGGYRNWTQPCGRLLGQCVALGLSVWICSAATLPRIVIHVQHPLVVVFSLELIATMIEHLAVVYIIVPLLPPENSHGADFKFPKVKAKSHQETMAPSNQSVLHAAFTFGTVHFCLWRAFNAEMNMAVTILVAYVRQFQLDNNINNSSFDNYALNRQNISANIISRSLLSTTIATGPSLDISPWTHGATALWGQCAGILLCIIYVVLYIPRENKSLPIVKRSSLY